MLYDYQIGKPPSHLSNSFQIKEGDKTYRYVLICSGIYCDSGSIRCDMAIITKFAVISRNKGWFKKKPVIRLKKVWKFTAAKGDPFILNEQGKSWTSTSSDFHVRGQLVKVAISAGHMITSILLDSLLLRIESVLKDWQQSKLKFTPALSLAS